MAKKFSLLLILVVMSAALGCSASGKLRDSTSVKGDEETISASQIAAEQVEKWCRTESGTQVYRRPEKVSGFVFLPDASYRDEVGGEIADQTWGGCSLICLEYLFRGYSYVEAPYLPADGEPAAGIFDLASERGLYRYEVKSRAEADCSRHDFLLALSDSRRRLPPAAIVDRHPEEMAGRCLVASKIAEFGAVYGYQKYSIQRPIPGLKQKRIALQVGDRVVELGTNRTIAVGTGFVFAYLDEWSNRKQVSCGPKGLLTLDTILVPTNTTMRFDTGK